MANKTINGRIVHKHDTETNWSKATSFIPMAGELIVYDIDDTYDYERIKIGDGVQSVNDLPFISEQFPVRTLSWLAEKYPELVVVSEGTSTRRYSFYFYYDEAKRIPRGLYVNDYQNDDNKSFAYTLYVQNVNVLSVNSTTSYVGIFTKTYSSGNIFYGFYTDTRYAGININSDGTYALSDKIQVYRDEVLHLANTTAYAPTSDYHPATKKYVDDSIAPVSVLVGDTSVAEQITEAISDKVDKVDGKGLSTNDYTTTEKSKLAGIASGAEVNQNAFSNITVGSTTIAADAKTDTLTIAAGSNVTITPDATNDKITIAATDTVYTHPTYTSKSAGLYKVTVDGTGHVSGTTAVAKSDITALGIPAQDTTYNEATTSAAGLMSASDKSKLDGIATGANKITVDSALSSTSTNPVQNKVVNTAISNLNTLVGDTSVSSQITTAVSIKADADHTHTAAEVGADESGAADSALSSAQSYTDTKISDLIDEAPTTLNTLGKIATVVDTKADADHTHNYAGSSDIGGSALVSESDRGITTEGSGEAYTATVEGISALDTGVSFIMIPHTSSTSTTPTLNVNDLGAKTIARRLSNFGTGTQAGYTTGWLASGVPFRVTYDGTQWVVSGMEKPAAVDLYGVLSEAKGGTGCSDFFAVKEKVFSYIAASDLSDVGSLYSGGLYKLPNNSTTDMNLPIASWSPLFISMGAKASTTNADDGYYTGNGLQTYYTWDGSMWIRIRQWNTWSDWIQYYNSNNVIYSSTQPTYTEGAIWLKPVE